MKVGKQIIVLCLQICHSLYPTNTIAECEDKLIMAIEKYDLMNEDIDEGDEGYLKQRIAEESLNTLEFEYKILVTNGSLLAQGLKFSICQGVFNDDEDRLMCVNSLTEAFVKLSSIFDIDEHQASPSVTKHHQVSPSVIKLYDICDTDRCQTHGSLGESKFIPLQRCYL